jgi:hypothetical protein
LAPKNESQENQSNKKEKGQAMNQRNFSHSEKLLYIRYKEKSTLRLSPVKTRGLPRVDTERRF